MAIKENFNTVYRGLIQAKKIKDENNAAIEKISENDVWSDDYKLSMRNKINADTIEKVSALVEEMKPTMQQLKEELQAPQKNFDLCSVKMQNAMQLVKLSGGKKIPESVEESIVEQMGEEVAALEILLPMFQDAGMIIAAQAAEKKINSVVRDAGFVDQIDDVLYYAMQSACPDGGIEMAINAAKSFAYTKGIEITD